MLPWLRESEQRDRTCLILTMALTLFLREILAQYACAIYSITSSVGLILARAASIDNWFGHVREYRLIFLGETHNE